MHQFFGIIKTNTSHSDAHQNGINSVKNAYPRAFQKGRQFLSPKIDLLGDVYQAFHRNQSELYFCGELYPTPTGTIPDHQVADLLEKIETHGLHPTIASLNGRFLICYVNHKENQIHVINDQMGIQQVFYHHAPGFILFSSELKLLLKHPLCPNKIDWHQSLKRAIPFEVLNGEVNYNAWFKDVLLLKPGTDMIIHVESGQIQKQEYWDPYPQIGETNYKNSKEAMDDYMALLEDAVKIRIQDQNNAYSLLSGGLDSSIICAIAAKTKSLDSFSVITRTTMLEETTKICYQLAKDQGFANTQFVIPMHKLEGEPEFWKKRIWHAESPTNHNDSMTKTLLHDAIRRHRPDINYVLTGTGSDQVNGGLARWIVQDSDDESQNWKNLADKITEIELRHHLPEKLHALWGSRLYLNRDFIHDFSGQAMQKNAFMFYIKSNLHMNHFVLLWDENRAAFAHRHSARYPFLDHRFLPMLSGIPENLHRELFYDKQILRISSKAYLPDYVLNKPKMPVDNGIYDHRFEEHRRMINPMKLDLLEEALGPIHESHPVIDKKALVKELERLYTTPDHKAWQYLLNVINLGIMEQLHLQDERSLNYEKEIEPMTEVVEIIDALEISRLTKLLDIIPEDEILLKPLHFNENCSIVIEHGTGKEYIQKNEILVYELQTEEIHWRKFLFAINGQLSAKEILELNHSSIDEIRDYFNLCVKENILNFN